MKVTALNLQWPVLTASLQKFHPQPQRSFTTGCE